MISRAKSITISCYEVITHQKGKGETALLLDDPFHLTPNDPRIPGIRETDQLSAAPAALMDGSPWRQVKVSCNKIPIPISTYRKARKIKGIFCSILARHPPPSSGFPFSWLLARTFGDPGAERVEPLRQKSKASATTPSMYPQTRLPGKFNPRFSLRGPTRVLFQKAPGAFASISSFRPSI